MPQPESPLSVVERSTITIPPKESFIMNKHEQARLDMLKRVGDFGTINATAFTTSDPSTPLPG
jgi:hypothetical protein